MSFTEAIRSVLNQYAGFTGRARRSEYWYWTLFYIILSIIASMLDRAVFNTTYGSWFSAIVGLGLLIPSLAVAVRRLHDTSRSGWWILLGLIPVVGAIILIVFYVQDSHGDNQYGPSPKAVGSAPGSAPGPAPTPA
jgi:uncharacterized membrane protein YhaH (DUF805 family)